jgi:hypothetical protein
LELWHESGWTLKVYGVAYRRERPREELVEAAKEIARKRLTNSTNKDNHYRVGFLGVHDGRGANFVYLDYWADENELHHHVYVSPSEEPASFEYFTPMALSSILPLLLNVCLRALLYLGVHSRRALMI